jgi:hypothetical protein
MDPPPFCPKKKETDMFKTIPTIWLPTRRQAHAVEAARQQAAVEAQQQAEMGAKEEEARKVPAQHLQDYEAHVKAVDLNGIATRDGHPLKLSQNQRDGHPPKSTELEIEVKKRLRLATNAKRDPQISLADKVSDEAIAAITSKLDQSALEWLWNHGEPEEQRKAAVAIRNARADLDEFMPRDRYVMIIAEAIARSKAKMRPNKILVAVGVRAILLRSADSRWTRTRRSELRPLSEPHW